MGHLIADEHSDLLLAAIVKLTEAMALLHEITRRREEARIDPFLDGQFSDSELSYIARIYSAVELHNKFLEQGNEGLFSVGGKSLNKRIKTVRDFIVISEVDLLRVPNIGRKSVNDVKAVLAANGVKLAQFKWWNELENQGEVA